MNGKAQLEEIRRGGQLICRRRCTTSLKREEDGHPERTSLPQVNF